MMDFLYQELDAAQTQAYRAHLGGCSKCTALLAGYERTRQTMRMLPELEPSPSLSAKLLAEAARRPAVAVEVAPVSKAPPREDEPQKKGLWAWISGWMQPLVATPAFGAVAGVILVGGVAGFLYMKSGMPKRGADVASPAAEAQLERQKNAESAAAPTAGAPSTATTVPGGADAPAAAADPGASDSKLRFEAERDGYVARGQDENNQREAEKAEKSAEDHGDGAEAGGARARMASPKEEAALGGVIGGAPAGPKGGGRGGGAGDLDLAQTDKEGRAAGGERARRDAPKDATVAQKKPADPAPPVAAPPPAEPAPTVAAKPPAPPAKNAPRPDAKPGAGKQAAPAQPPRGEAFDDDAAGAVAEAEEAPMAPSADTRTSTGSSEKKKAPAKSSEAEAKKLHGQARAKANTGDCGAALKLRDRIYRVDPGYFDRSVKNDGDLRRCTERQNKSPAKPARKSADEAAQEAPAPAKE